MKQIKWIIYCHIHHESDRRYVGLTKMTWRKRWNRHVYCAVKRNDKTHFANAIRKYGKDAFDHKVLEVCNSLEEGNAAEEKWIEHFDSTNPEKGFNLKRGGAHTPHPVKNPWDRPEFRAKMKRHLKSFIAAGQSPEARAASKAALNTPESKVKRSAAAKASLARPETRKKREAMRADPAYGKTISDSLKASLFSDEARARMSEASRSSATPEVRERRSASLRKSMSRPKTRQKLSVSSKRAWSDPEYREKILSRETSEETRKNFRKPLPDADILPSR